MPLLDDFDATRAIRMNGLRMLVIAVSASAFAEEEKHVEVAGVNAHLAKPVNADEPSRLLRFYLVG